MPDESRHAPLRAPAAERIQRLVRRCTWLVAGAFLVGAPGAYLASTGFDVSYTAEGALWIESAPRRGSDAVTPMQAGTVPTSAWVELLRSYQVLEPVVVEQRLNVRTSDEHAPAFTSFRVSEPFVPGAYELRVGGAGEHFVLVDGQGAEVQRGALGSPIGRSRGFVWTPSPTSFTPGAAVRFSVLGVREAAQDLSESITTVMDREGNFIRVALTGRDPRQIAVVLNAVMERHVDLAGELKRTKLEDGQAVLEAQLQAIEVELERAVTDLEKVLIGAIRAPADRSIAPTAQTAEEGRLSRRVRATENLYDETRERLERARLASASLIPDVRILDRATVRERREGPGMPISLAIVLACLATALGSALLLDRLEAVDAADS